MVAASMSHYGLLHHYLFLWCCPKPYFRRPPGWPIVNFRPLTGERNKESYYLALRRTLQTIRKEEQNWEPWLVFFLKTIGKQKEKCK